MKTIEKIKTSYDRLKELDEEVLFIGKMCEKLAIGNPSIAKLELKIKEEESPGYYDIPENHRDSHMMGLFRSLYPSGIDSRENQLIDKKSDQPKLLLEYTYAITFLDILLSQKNKERQFHLDFLTQFENKI